MSLLLPPPPQPVLQSHHRGQAGLPVLFSSFPSSCLFYTWQCIYVKATFSV